MLWAGREKNKDSLALSLRRRTNPSDKRSRSDVPRAGFHQISIRYGRVRLNLSAGVYSGNAGYSIVPTDRDKSRGERQERIKIETTADVL